MRPLFSFMGGTMQIFLRLAFAACLSGIGPAAAQEQAKPPAPNAQQTTIAAATLVVIIKGTVMALQQANATGNYSVLRDLGTPVFREKFNQAALTQAFANLRARKLDLSPALLVNPNLAKNPELKDGELILTGNFPTQPLHVTFDLRFVQLDGIWRLAGIGVDAVPAPQSMAAITAPVEQPATANTGKKHPAKPKT